MRTFARWRMKVWDRRLETYRRAWHNTPEDSLVWYDLERLVTRALVRRTKWRKRAGIVRSVR